MLIDGHCHLGSGDGFTGPWDTRASLELYLPRALQAGIERTIVFAPFNRDYDDANNEVLAWVRRFPSRLLPFFFVHPERDRGRVMEKVTTARQLGGCLGLKVHKHDSPLSRETCVAAEKHRIPVLYDVMGDVHPMALFAREFPDVAFILPHLGSFGDDWRAHETTIDLLVRFPNVFADTSGVRRFDYLQEAVQRAGAHKIIFGSDGPFLHPALELEKIRLLRLSPRDEAMVLGTNMVRLMSGRWRGICRHGRAAGCGCQCSEAAFY